MDLSSLSDRERLVLGLRLRLKHIRLAIAEVDAGRTPEGFDFPLTALADDMRDQLRALETEVRSMLRDNGAGEGSLN